MSNEADNYVTMLLQPRAKASQERRVWSMPLDSCVVPYLTSMNVLGKSHIPHDALGAPVRLGYAKDGAVKFNPKGRPVFVVADPIKDAVALMRENLIANMKAKAHEIATGDLKDAYEQEVRASVEAAKPIRERDTEKLASAERARFEAEIAKAAAQAKTTLDNTIPEGTPEHERELVSA